MILLDGKDISIVRSLLTEETNHYPLIKSILEGKLESNVYVDNIESINSAFVMGENGWCYLLGSSHDNRFNESVIESIKNHIIETKNPVLWFGIPQSQRNALESVERLAVNDYPRYRFRFDRNQFKQLSKLNLNYEIEELSAFNIKEFIQGCSYFETFWNDELSFLKNGLGFIAKNNEEIIGHAISASVNDEEVEIDLCTNEKFRGQGISTRLVFELVDACITSGLQPKWDCSISNGASLKLAENNGFEIIEKYQFSYIEYL